MCAIPAALATAPSWLGTVSTIASIASVGLQAFGSYQQSQSTKSAYEYQSAIARNNAITAEYQAEDAIKRGQIAEEQQRRKTMMLKGTQTARLAANGIDISEGSPLQILSDTDWMGEQDALTIRDNANREAWGYRVQGQNQSSDSNMLKATADAQNPLLAGTSSLLSNIGAAGNKDTDTDTDTDANTKTSILGDTENPGLVNNKWYKMSDGFNKPNELSIFGKYDDAW
jgi:hypothetical protein